MKPATLKLLLLPILVALLAPIAQAQLQGTFTELPIPSIPTSDTKRPATIEAVRLGFSGIIPADSWTPIRIYLSGNPRINAGAFGGTLTVEYTQDATQSARIITPIATTPGRVLPVEVIVAMPRGAPDLRITLRDDAGNFIHDRTFARRGALGESFPGEIVDGANLVLVLLDRDETASSMARFLSEPSATLPFGGVPPHDEEEKTPPVFDGLTRVLSTPLDLPSSDFGFDGLFAMIAKSDSLSRLPRAKSEALARWVQSGGCLVVVTTPGPQSWPKLFADTPPIELLEPEAFTPGASLRTVFAAHPSALLASISGRAIRVTADGPARGWRTGWTSDENDSTETAGLLAEGPVGLGWVVVLGASPDYFSTTAAGSRSAWFDALKHALAERDQRPFRNSMNYWRSRGSGPDQSARATIRVLLNSLSEIPPLGDWAFIIVVLSLLLLAIALGPFDAVFLSMKRLRTLSWATAFGWIALAAAIAALVPPLIRSGDSISRRLRVVDVLQSDQHPPQCWQTALTTLFSNSTNSVALVSDSGPEAAAPTSSPGWFRGISPVRIEDHSDSRPIAGFSTMQMEVRDAGEIDAAGFRVNQPDLSNPIAMGQWTFRTIMDEQSPANREAVNPPVITLDRKDHAWNVHATNTHGKFVSGALRIGSAWFNLEKVPEVGPVTQNDAEAGNVLQLRSLVSTGLPSEWTSRANPTTGYLDDFANNKFSPGVTAELPGTRNRSRALDALLASGAWACIYLYETDTPPTLLAKTRAGRGAAFQARESTVWRILVPLESFDRENPVPLSAAKPSEFKAAPQGTPP